MRTDTYLIDETGTAFGVKNIGGKIRTSSTPYGYDIAKGDVTNHYALHKFGINADIDTVLEPVWSKGGNYPYLTAAEKLQVSAGAADVGTLLSTGTADSTSTAATIIDSSATFVTDTVAAGDVIFHSGNSELHGIVVSVDSETQLTVYENGSSFADVPYKVVTPGSTGASVVSLLGLDANYNPLIDHVILNGATDVASNASFLRIFRARVVAAGSGGANSGIIDIQNNAASATLAEIRAGIQQTEMALWTVPAGFALYITSINMSESNNVRATGTIYERHQGEVFRPQGFSTTAQAAGSQIIYTIPLKIKAKTDIEFRAIGDLVNASVAASFEGWYE